LEAALADHNAVLIGVDDVTSAGHARMMAKVLARESRPSWMVEIVPLGMFQTITRAISHKSSRSVLLWSRSRSEKLHVP
jgi:hypothetical protein